MSYHEKKWLDECPDEIKPIKYRRYVDDIFVLCRDREHHEKFKEYMNSKHENISFTDELEENNLLPFLDVAVTRTDDGFTTNLYRKGTLMSKINGPPRLLGPAALAGATTNLALRYMAQFFDHQEYKVN